MKHSIHICKFVVVLLLLPTGVARSQACPEPSTALRAVAKGRGGTLQDYQRAVKIRSTFNKLAFKTRVEPHWIADSARFWYRNETRQGKEFILVDAEKGTRGPQSFSTPKTFRPYYNAQSVAELGFLVIMVDGLGMGGPDPVGITITHTKTSAPASAGASLSPRTRGAACQTTPTHRGGSWRKKLVPSGVEESASSRAPSPISADPSTGLGAGIALAHKLSRRAGTAARGYGPPTSRGSTMSFADSSFAVALLRRMDALIKADKDFDMTKPEDRRQMTEKRRQKTQDR